LLRLFIVFYQLFISYAWLLKAFLYSFHKQTLPYTFAYTKILYTAVEKAGNGNVAEVTILAQHGNRQKFLRCRLSGGITPFAAKV